MKETFRNTLLNFGVGLILAAATLTVYARTVRFEFLEYDDPKYVTRNEQVLAGLTWPSVRWAFTAVHASNWHPLTWLSHMVDVELFGQSPAGPHAVNLALHILNTLLLFGLLARMTGKIWAGCFVAGLFALHPLHVESVAWVAERKDVLSTFLGFLTLWAYVHFTRRGGPVRYVAALILFAMGLLAKPMLVTLPCVLLLLDYWPLRRVVWRSANRPSRSRGTKKGARARRAESSAASPAQAPHSVGGIEIVPRSIPYLLLEKIPFFILAILSCYATYAAQSLGPAMDTSGAVAVPDRLANAAVAYVWYIAKMFWPAGLGPLYTHPNLPGGDPWPQWMVGGAVILLLISSLLLLFVVRKPYVTIGWLWYVGTLVPVIGLVQVGNQAFADRYTYIPLIGLFLMMAYGVSDWISRSKQRTKLLRITATLGAVLLLTGCGIASSRQVQYWRNSTTLFERGVAVRPTNPTMNFNLGNMRREAGDLDGAIKHYRAATTAFSGYWKAWFNLGLSLKEQGAKDEALEALQGAIRARPNYARAHKSLGELYEDVGRWDEAIRHYREAARLDPSYASLRQRAEWLQRRRGE